MLDMIVLPNTDFLGEKVIDFILLLENWFLFQSMGKLNNETSNDFTIPR